jgi:hypothetical protein
MDVTLFIVVIKSNEYFSPPILITSVLSRGYRAEKVAENHPQFIQ